MKAGDEPPIGDFPLSTHPVRFLTTSGVAAALEDLTRDARRQLVLVTPYLKLSANFADRLADADARGVEITLVYGKDELAARQRRRSRPSTTSRSTTTSTSTRSATTTRAGSSSRR